MRVCGLQRLDDKLLCTTSDQPTNQLPPIHTHSPSVDLVWSGYCMRWFDFVDSMVNQQLAFSCEIWCTADSLNPACWYLKANTQPTDSMVVNSILTWLDAARPTHSIPLPALHFIDIAATSESHSWLLTLVIALSTQLVRFLHCWDFSFRKLYLLRRAVTIYCDSLRPIRYTPGNFIR